MERASIPKNEAQRLVSLHNLGLLDTPQEERFDVITRTATRIFHVPISTLTLVDAKREWFKSCQGLSKREGDRAISFCGHALLADNVFVIPDTLKDKKFFDNPMVLGKPYIRFYAGVPIMSAGGERVGVFCVKDTKPRVFSKEDREVLKGLAVWAEVEINSRNLSIALQEERGGRIELKGQQQGLENAKIAARNVLDDLEIEKRMLAEAKAKDDAMLASIGDGVIIIDTVGKITFMNHSAQRSLGWQNTEVEGKLLFDIVPIEDEGGAQVTAIARPMTLALTSGDTAAKAERHIDLEPATSETYYYVRRDKTRFPAAVTVAPVILDDKIIGAIEIFRDVTKERGIEKAKSEFVSLASHQLRTPLTGIEWTLELFSRKEHLTEKGRGYLNDIHFSVKRLSALVKLLLNASRIESGIINVSPEPLELVGFINEHINENQILCEKIGSSLIFTRHPEKLIAVTDKNLLIFIVQNIIANAIEYTPSGGHIEITLEGQGGTLLFTVRDTGIGIPAREQAYIFRKFTRASNAISIKPDGTGMGLYIVQEAVKILGGKIRFESQENKGSTFCVELPLTVRTAEGTKH